ncbi:MAG: right-handed parallel beta-helix repeat-containing protein, partial [bacterium]|nr:right-handed parallel beta-helix repeat-containing protein [bacterium]
MGVKHPMRFAALSAAFFFMQQSDATVWMVKPSDDLQTVIDHAVSNDTLQLGNGTWKANPVLYNDPFCGNCLDSSIGASATIGFIVQKNLTLQGTSSDSTILETNAGYGIFIAPQKPKEQNLKVHLSNLRVTGGIRDIDGNETDAEIVIRNSEVTIRNCTISGNTHRADSVIVGIAGIAGREGAILKVEDCIIRNNGWDGIALYRGTRARIVDVTIEKGRGAGIGITWDAQAEIIRTTVSDYWKGIGT